MSVRECERESTYAIGIWDARAYVKQNIYMYQNENQWWIAFLNFFFHTQHTTHNKIDYYLYMYFEVFCFV